MIRKIRNSRYSKGVALLLVVSFLSEIFAPTSAMALTGGPAQPEFNSFTPIGTSDMVNLSSGDFTYNIPLVDVGGYPLNLAYNSGVGMDQEASWVGLGWDLSVGQINRNVRGLPDDFKGDEMQYENHMKPNITVGGSFKFTPALFGAELLDGQGNAQEDESNVQVSIGLSLQYNSYEGFSVAPSVGASAQGALGSQENSSVGFNASVESGPDGLSISPNLSFHGRVRSAKKHMNSLGSEVGIAYNSRRGLSSMSLELGTSRRTKTYRKVNGLTSNINFTDQLYTPTKRVGMTTTNFSVNLALGAEIFGGEGQGQARAFGSEMKVSESERDLTLPGYGYSHTHEAGIDAILDFNREKDGAVSKNTTNLALTNYTYDIYTVQGQGVAGTYRPYRNQVGFVTDPYVTDGSSSITVGGELGTGNTAHGGFDFEATDVFSYSGLWSQNNLMLPFLEKGSSSEYSPGFEDVHYANVGDLSASTDYLGMFNPTGNYDATRVDWNDDGPKFNRKAKSNFKKKYHPTGAEQTLSINSKINRNNRQSRNQAIVNLTWEDLDNGVGYGPNVNRDGSSNMPGFAKSHHTAEVQIIRNDGARYVYGIPAYNTTKREATFAVENNGDCLTGLVSYNPTQIESPESLPGDQFLDRTTTPAYVHTHLLTSVLSTDYRDRTNNGPTRDDFGSYTKFEYDKTPKLYNWRVPYNLNQATYNEGLKADEGDERGNYVYGEKEQYYIKTIETKTHVARFYKSEREDGHGVENEAGGIDEGVDSYKLDSIELYSIEEYDQIGSYAPIKTVHFKYSYDLCPGVHNNQTGGKLTLEKVYFTYRGSRMGKYTPYKFTYPEDEIGNPSYDIKGYDSWGNYKPNEGSCLNSGETVNSEFPFTNQDRALQDQYAEAWSLKEIELPSGGKITVDYESDDYQYVQNKRTMKMFKVAGTGGSNDGTGLINDSENSALLFDGQLMNSPRTYLYVEVDDNTSTNMPFSEIKKKYLEDVINEPIYFRFLMNMTQAGNSSPDSPDAKFEYVSGYFEYEEVNSSNGYNGDSQIFSDNGKKYLSIPVRIVEKEGGLIGSTGLTNKVHPISKAGWHFGRKYLNKHVFSNQANGDTDDIEEIAADLFSPHIINNLIEAFTGPNATLENKNIARRFMKKKSWIRLNNPEPNKLGGGSRVTQVKMSDVWEVMNPGQGDYQTMNYGQQYDYTLDDGTTSGVATYEPVGNKENPFVQPVFSSVKKLLAPNENNFVEKPFGESFFPAPQVTYSKVTVSNLVAGEAPANGFTDPVVKKLHRTGKVVTYFYTSKDYPVIVDQTRMVAKEDKQELLGNILKLNVKKHFTATQGYTIHLNDMNGKEKKKEVFAEGQDGKISSVEYIYDNHSISNAFTASSLPSLNKGKLNNKVVVIHPDGSVTRSTVGVETDVVNDFRENATETTVSGMNANLATFIAGVIPGIVPIPLPDFSSSEDKMRIATTTKVINTFGILKETIAYDAGSKVYTRNLAWDAKTGEVLLTETVDEYDDKYYTMNYPAHWYYEGMGQAADNILFENSFSEIGSSGVYELTLPPGKLSSDYLVPGDEVLVSGGDLLWVSYVGGNEFHLMNEDGILQSGLGSGSLKIIRSGKRNLQSAGIMNVTLVKNPLIDGNTGNLINELGEDFLTTTSTNNSWEEWRIINAGAVDYSDNWEPPCECTTEEETSSNPYVMNERGVWRTKSSRTYLTGRNHQTETTPRQEGFFSEFRPMYIYTPNGNLMKDFTDWTFTSEVTVYSPYGFELENRDALDRYSAAQYGYNNTFPLAVGANTKYSEIGYDGFEDYGFDGCEQNGHFNFKDVTVPSQISPEEAHTGKYSVQLSAGEHITLLKQIGCAPTAQP